MTNPGQVRIYTQEVHVDDDLGQVRIYTQEVHVDDKLRSSSHIYSRGTCR